MAAKMFLCGRLMKPQDGLLYKLCTNPQCLRSKLLSTPEEDKKTTE